METFLHSALQETGQHLAKPLLDMSFRVRPATGRHISFLYTLSFLFDTVLGILSHLLHSGTHFPVDETPFPFFKTSVPPRGEISLNFWYRNNLQYLNCPTGNLCRILPSLKWCLHPTTCIPELSIPSNSNYPPPSWFPALSSLLFHLCGACF